MHKIRSVARSTFPVPRVSSLFGIGEMGGVSVQVAIMASGHVGMLKSECACDQGAPAVLVSDLEGGRWPQSTAALRAELASIVPSLHSVMFGRPAKCQQVPDRLHDPLPTSASP